MKKAADELFKIEGTGAYRVPTTPIMEGKPHQHTPVLSDQQIQSAIQYCPGALISSIQASSIEQGAVIDRGIQDLLRSRGEDTRGGARDYNNTVIHSTVDESGSTSSARPRP